MLTSDLLLARIRYGYVYPAYARLNPENLKLAEALIQLFKKNIGANREELARKLSNFELEAFRRGFHYKYVRGLAYLLNRQAVYEAPETRLDPLKVRIEVFKEASKIGLALTENERTRVLQRVAARFRAEMREVEQAFNASYQENEILKKFQPITAEQLLKSYNLSLTQTLLFKALDITVETKAPGYQVKILLFNVKRLGLMYFAEKHNSELSLKLDGPASLLKQTERYGTRLAKLLPYIVAMPRWRLKARIRLRGRILAFMLNDKNAPPMPEIELKIEPYDSDVEEDFYRRFSKAGSGWKILREPDPVLAGNSIMIPDFAFELYGEKVYFEIVGYWTPSYLKKKVEKLRQARNLKMILAVDRERACAPEILSLPYVIIPFKRRIPIDEVYRVLRRMRPKTARKKTREEYENPEAMQYLKTVEKAKLSEVYEKLREIGVPESQIPRLIERAGLKVDWSTLDPSKATVRRAQKGQEKSP